MAIGNSEVGDGVAVSVGTGVGVFVRVGVSVVVGDGVGEGVIVALGVFVGGKEVGRGLSTSMLSIERDTLFGARLHPANSRTRDI